MYNLFISILASENNDIEGNLCLTESSFLDLVCLMVQIFYNFFILVGCKHRASDGVFYIGGRLFLAGIYLI